MYRFILSKIYTRLTGVASKDNAYFRPVGSGGQGGSSPPNKFENNGATSHKLIRCIVLYCFKNNCPPQSEASSYGPGLFISLYLAAYEKLHFLGEDGDDNSSDYRKTVTAAFFASSGVNFNHANFHESTRKNEPGPLGEPRVSNFNRLVFSLLSGLPNETDFAMNICTLLSNVTNSIFNLAKAPNIVNLLLAHVGIFSEEQVSLRELYKEWYQESDRDFNKFWRESIDDETVKEIYDSVSVCGTSFSEDNAVNPFCNPINKLAESVEAKRVHQVCVILHNFSYEELNCLYISSHETCRRFLALCAGSKLSSLRKTALDTLDNLADKMTLGIVQDRETQTQLRVLHSFLFSKDRTRKVRAISILAKLSSHEENEDVLSEALSEDIYSELIRCLTAPDIQLILNSLDALYYLSDLGEATATAIVLVYKSIDVLVCLVTVHAESYGNRAIAGFRIVENKNSVHAQKHAAAIQQNHQRNMALQQMQRGYAQMQPVVQPSPMPQVRSSPKVPIAPNFPVVRPDVHKQEENEEVEPEIFAARWISAFYELAPGCEVQRSQILNDYVESCKELGRKGVLNMQSFYKILGLVIPAQYWRPADGTRDEPLITGIKKRAIPLMVRNKATKVASRVPRTASPHNDQQMPVRPIPVMPTVNTPQQQQKLPASTANVAGGVSASTQQVAIQPGQQGLPVMFQMQGPRAPFSAATVSAQASQIASTAAQMPLNSQRMPLKLLEQHVNAQGKDEEATATAPQKLAAVDQTMPKPAAPEPSALNQAPMQQQLVKQPAGVAQAQASLAGMGQGIPQAVVGSVPQAAQNVMLPPGVQGVVLSMNNAGSSSADASANQQLDPEAKLNPQQKLSSKERNERKKAMKAARDMINADIRASNLEPLAQCQNLTDRIQKEMQQHFVQFHVHQQSIQAIQAQLQQVVIQNSQSKLPQNIMEDIHNRVRNHHAQMQAHYQKLQQLQILLQQVKIRLVQEQKLKGISEDAKEPGKDTSTPVVPQIAANTQRLPNPQPAPGFSTDQAQASLQLPLVQPLSSASKNATATSAIFGVSSMQSLSVGVQNPVFAGAAISQGHQISFIPTGMSQQIVTANGPSAATGKSDSKPMNNVMSMASSAIAPSTSLSHKPMQSVTNVVPAQVGLVPAQGPMKGPVRVPAPASLTGTNIQLAHSSLATPLHQVAPMTKTGAITYNTPILPRPQLPTSMTIQNAGRQGIPSSAMPGQTVLLTMPVMALPQQALQATSGKGGQVILPKLQTQPVGSVTENMVGSTLIPSSGFMQVGQPNFSVTSSGVNFIPTVNPHALVTSQVKALVNTPQSQTKQQKKSNPVTHNDSLNLQQATCVQRVKPSLQSKTTESSQSVATKVPIGKSSVNKANNSTTIPVSLGLLGTQMPISKVTAQQVMANGPIIRPTDFGSKQTVNSSSAVVVNGGVDIGARKGPNVHAQSNMAKADTTIKVVDQNGGYLKKSDDGNCARDVSTSLNHSKTNSYYQTSITKPAVNGISTTSNSYVSDNHTDSKCTITSSMNESRKRTIEKVSDTNSDQGSKKNKLENCSEVASDSKTKDLGNRDNFTDKYDSMIKNNKKFRINGIYTKNSKENGDHETVKMEICQNNDSKNDSSETVNVNSTSMERNSKSVSSVTSTNCESSSALSTATSPSLTTAVSISSCSTEQSNVSNTGSQKISDTQSSTEKSSASDMKSGKKEKDKHHRKKFSCQWTGCKSHSASTNDLISHMVLTHAPSEGHLKICKVPGCKPVQRPRGSMICHFKQVHCNTNTASDDDHVTLPQLLFPKVVDIEREDESPVTRSVRLTAALILRNIARNSALGRKVIMNYESRLVLAAMSSSEASMAVSTCLEELSRKRRKPSDCCTSEDETS
eukprot:Seg1221.12 transcript_id=Seg1221.12/GoldUCD/mRNA.D3Y31 product="AT-rich interactive domain-containing protein 2" protein_id=Seg1221.12/GoldUCD/D3Y31